MCLAFVNGRSFFAPSRLRVRINRVRFHAKARSREVKTSVYFGLAVLDVHELKGDKSPAHFLHHDALFIS
jgi:hypothetical protein